MKNFIGSNADDCVTTRQDGGDAETILFNGTPCLAAQHIYLAGLGATDEECTGGKLVLIRGGVGIHQNISPDNMRGFAAALIKMADLADTNSARMAAAVIAAAGKSRS